MIRGVNKQIVEINYTKNEYIQRAILFINPEKSELPDLLLNQKALDYMEELITATKKEKKRKKIRLLPFLLSGGILILLGIFLLILQ